MPLPKESYYDGERSNPTVNKFFIVIGLIGASILLFSLSLTSPQIGYILGSSCMLAVAFYYKLVYFIALEIILIAGHSAILLGIGPVLQVALPCLLCFQLFVYYVLTDQLNNIILLIGIAGISLLSIGFAYNNQWIFFTGSTAVAIYSLDAAIKGIRPCYIWGILNLLFAGITFSMIFLK